MRGRRAAEATGGARSTWSTRIGGSGGCRRRPADYADAYNNRGSAKAVLRQHDAALADYDEAIRLKPDSAAYSNRGVAKVALGQLDAALADYDEAIRLKPDSAEVYSNRGEAKAALKLKDEARKDFEITIDLARKAGDANVLAAAEKSLRDLK